MEQHNEKWFDLGIREQIQYIISVLMIISGIVMGFLSFFLNEYDINNGVLLYIAQAFLIGGTLLGSSLYLKTKWIEFKSDSSKEIDDKIEALSKKFEINDNE